MKLSIGNQPIAISQDANISIEKSSPVLGSDATSFSYPFPVPRLPNQQALGGPGILERIWELPGVDPFWGIPPTRFILEDQGIQVLAGEVEFDDIDDKEIGVILKSGTTEFWSKIKDVMMSDIDLGSEAWLTDVTTSELINAKFTEWAVANESENAPVISVPFLMDNADNTAEVLVNIYNINPSAPEFHAYMLQFRAWYLIGKIFEHFNYTVAVDALGISEFAQLIVFSKPFYFQVSQSEEDPAVLWVYPIADNLIYADLMPSITVQDFLDGIKSLPGLIFLIDDQKKEVSITFQRDLFLNTNIDLMQITELKGWAHREHESTDGFQLAYQGQDDENDTKIDYIINQTVEDNLPALTIEGIIVHVNNVNMDFISKKRASDSSLYWSIIGRLKPYINGNGGLKIEFPVKVPQSHQLDYNLHPYLPLDLTTKMKVGLIYSDMTELYVSLYRGIVNTHPLICAEKWSPDANPSLVPADLYASSFVDYLIWKSTTARGFTKYIQLTLPQLMALQWGKRYFISGIRVVLEKINYDVPFTGIVKIDGYTA